MPVSENLLFRTHEPQLILQLFRTSYFFVEEKNQIEKKTNRCRPHFPPKILKIKPTANLINIGNKKKYLSIKFFVKNYVM